MANFGRYLKPQVLDRAYLQDEPDDDAAEGREDPSAAANKNKDVRNKRRGGQNKDRHFGHSHDTLPLCTTLALVPEFSPKTCKFGERCNRLHDLRKYLKEGRRGDLDSFGGKCPVYEAQGKCTSGWRCRFLSSHSTEVEREDGRSELVLLENGKPAAATERDEDDLSRPGVLNNVAVQVKHDLSRKRIAFEKSDPYIKWMSDEAAIAKSNYKKSQDTQKEESEEQRASFTEPPLRPSEKRRVYFGRETPVLAPLTTQGNLPFRRLAVELGAQLTYSEMAMTMDLMGGKKPEWALMRAHESEVSPPKVSPGHGPAGYDNSRDLKFGAQVAANQPWVATKATEAMAMFLPHLRVIDLNCGCPIDAVYQTGAGSGLLDATTKLERIVRAMNTVSGEIPITAKLRIGTKAAPGQDTAKKNIARLAFGGSYSRDRLGAPGCAAITLHGRTRQQRYRKPADWAYIAECATLIKSYHKDKDAMADTVREPETNTLANGERLFFLGNGDCYSHVDYFNHVDNAGVDTVMIGRGALVKPWIFEEIQAGQFLDKSSSERLTYIEKFAKYGLELWGSDEMGIGTTRRFLLEYLNFACRYIPVGLLDYLPPVLNERAPAYKGRNELETLMASGNYKDWIKIR
jgi:tRNA-dihydrouridine synthase 3